jgi:transcription elongation factor GreA
MNNELTKTDIEKMRAELDERRLKLMPELIEEVKRTRAFGDLSENYEYKAAKQAQNRNRSRIRYLERMIASAKVIEDTSAEDEVGLYDKVEVYMVEDGETNTVRVVTTMRCDPLHGLISKDSPLGAALLGRRVGDRFSVQVSKEYGYTAEVRSIEKGSDDGSAALLQY